MWFIINIILHLYSIVSFTIYALCILNSNDNLIRKLNHNLLTLINRYIVSIHGISKCVCVCIYIYI